MIKLFCGEDTYASYQAAFQEANRLVAESGGELVVLNADELKREQELTQYTSGISLFTNHNVVVAKRLLDNSLLSKYVDASFADLAAADLIIWHDGKADGRSALVKTLKKEKAFVEFELPDPAGFNKWINDFAKTKQVELKPPVRQLLLDRVGLNKWQLAQEITKLSLYAKGVSPEITEDTVMDITGLNVEGDIWRFLDALTNGNRKVMIGEFIKLTEFSDNIQYLISMLTRELNILAQVVYLQDHHKPTDSLKMHPFVLKKTIQKAHKYPWAKIQKLYNGLFRLDLAIKQGRIVDEVGMLFYLLSW